MSKPPIGLRFCRLVGKPWWKGQLYWWIHTPLFRVVKFPGYRLRIWRGGAGDG